MSNVASANDSQSPAAEVLDRLAEQSPVLGLPRLIAVNNLQFLQADARQRTYDSHVRQMRALDQLAGDAIPVAPLALDEDMAINVTGDTHNHYQAPEPAPAAAAGMSTLAKAGVAAALVASGASVPLAGLGVASLLRDDPPAAVAPVSPAAPTTPVTDRDTYLPYEFSIE